jgi:hypothetical protein
MVGRYTYVQSFLNPKLQPYGKINRRDCFIQS